MRLPDITPDVVGHKATLTTGASITTGTITALYLTARTGRPVEANIEFDRKTVLAYIREDMDHELEVLE